MEREYIRRMAVTKLHALVGWILCGAVMYIGTAVTTLENTLIIHLAAAPVIFCAISLVYFKKFNYFSPREVAAVFLAVVVFMDLVVVSLIVEKSFDMFKSPVGTWIPFAFIFLVTYLTGRHIRMRR